MWYNIIFCLIAGVIAELIAIKSDYKNKVGMILYYFVFAFLILNGYVFVIIFFTDYAVSVYTATGQTEAMIMEMVSILKSYVVIISLILTVAGAIVGGFFGKNS
jgi:hypothetical protein